MSADEQKAMAERRKAMMEGDFNPGYSPTHMPQADVRLATAAEYAAYQLGQINRKLDKLIAALGSNDRNTRIRGADQGRTSQTRLAQKNTTMAHIQRKPLATGWRS